MSNKTFKQILSEEKFIGQTMTASVQQLKKTVHLLKYQIRFLKKASKQLLRRYSEQKTVVGGCVWKLLKSFATYFTEMGMCIDTAISEKCLQKLPELDHLREQLRHKTQRDPRKVMTVVLTLAADSV